MNQQLAKRLRKLAKEYTSTWVEYTPHPVQKDEKGNDIPAFQHVTLTPTCGRKIYQELKKAA
jgi:hypothetical protein